MAYPEKGVRHHHHRRMPDFMKAARAAEGVPEDEAPTKHPGLDMAGAESGDDSGVSGMMGEDDEPEQRADGGVARTARDMPPSVDETYAPPPRSRMEMVPQRDLDRRKAAGRPIVPIETGDKALISPEDIDDWKGETSPQRS